jgi:hypothetical protein
MKAIIDSTTGELLFTTNLDIDLAEGTLIIEDNPTGNYWDFENQVWYSVVDTNEMIKQAFEIDLYYTELISDLLRKHIEKKILRGIDIPQVVEDEVNRLRTECNQKIVDLGVTSFSYRQSNLKL